MNTCKAPSRQWRLNYIITYADRNTAEVYRSFLHSALIAVATLRRIDYAIKLDTRVLDELNDSWSTDHLNIVSDMLYFRSSPNSRSSIKEFRSLIDSLFLDYDMIFRGDQFEVYSLLQKHLKRYPFPDKFYRPLCHPYTEIHNGKEVTLCVDVSTLENLLNEAADSPS